MSKVNRMCRSATGCFAALMLLASVFICACGGTQRKGDEEETEAPPRFRYGNLPYEEMQREGVDVTRNGVEDQVYWRDADGVLRWVERDMNGDGRPDLIEHFDASGTVIEREFRLTFADAVTSVHFFRDGRLYLKELRTGFGSEHPIREFYDSEGRLLRLERDSTLNGRVDVWEYFDAGRLERVGRDTTGDGSPDTFDEIN